MDNFLSLPDGTIVNTNQIIYVDFDKTEKSMKLSIHMRDDMFIMLHGLNAESVYQYMVDHSYYMMNTQSNESKE